MTLNIKQRFAVVGIYISLIIIIGFYFSGDWRFLIDTNNKLNIVLIITALALILSSYISEPYFSKPVDVITRGIAIFLFLIGISDKENLLLYKFWLFASIILTIVSILLILLHGWSKFEKTQKLAVDLVCKISRPQIIFTLLYFDIVISFFQPKSAEYPILIGFGFFLAINKPIIWLVDLISKQLRLINSAFDSSSLLGHIIGYESDNLYKIEITSENHHRYQELRGKLVFLENLKSGIIGITICEHILLGKKWITILNLRDNENNLISFSLKTMLPLAGEKTIFSKSNAVFLLDPESLDKEIRDKIDRSPYVSNFNRFIGTVWEGSTINRIKFNKLFSSDLQKERGIGEGSIIQTEIAEEEVLYQIIDARTTEENLENKDSCGYTVGTAQKLGKYVNESNELNTVKWLPEIYAPIVLLDPLNVAYDPHNFIGKLPNTNYGIPIKNYDELVTHNTAILGILGIGKSCLTFELLQKLIENTNVKIICLDITNQYIRELPKYVDAGVIQNELTPASIAALKSGNNNGTDKNPNTWGNEVLYKTTLDVEINAFVTSTQRILVINPDLHNISKAGSQFNITHKVDLTPAEKVRIISERLIVKASSQGESKDARYLLVLEEAHSLVPEWSSVANDGDKNATNGTAKVILQGRKYGLGSLVITQRTANISKSILNQCNTIFALRVFDDTGKLFLENYIGSDYANILPTLEERHSVAIGKALKLKQPVIIELNNLNDIIIPTVQKETVAKN